MGNDTKIRDEAAISSNGVLNEVGGVVTLEQILTEDRFKKIAINRLREIINKSMSFEDFLKLEGTWSIDKAYILISKWKQ
jgi:hypothetical protein